MINTFKEWFCKNIMKLLGFNPREDQIAGWKPKIDDD
jgi:hypothetical protein